jgi:hypothetical protein
MNSSSLIRGVLPLAAAALLAGCAGMGMGPTWTTLIDGDKGLDNWNVVGDAIWRAEGGAIVSTPGKPSYLVSKASYRDFEIRAEFWAETDTNSGIFFRATDPTKITADNSYEANVWDIRPEPKYGTGAIVNFAEVPTPLQNKAGGKWNVMEIVAKGPSLTVKLNGVTTARINDGKYAAGPFALQYGPGVKGVAGGPIKWRKVQIRAI